MKFAVKSAARVSARASALLVFTLIFILVATSCAPGPGTSPDMDSGRVPSSSVASNSPGNTDPEIDGLLRPQDNGIPPEEKPVATETPAEEPPVHNPLEQKPATENPRVVEHTTGDPPAENPDIDKPAQDPVEKPGEKPIRLQKKATLRMKESRLLRAISANSATWSLLRNSSGGRRKSSQT